ncbi:MAG: Uncharacterised protein [Euryarchaeota archaeon UBA443]|nr:MAG: Uncharacterised protein [Euryarchaeota archaeon UBA443]
MGFEPSPRIFRVEEVNWPRFRPVLSGRYRELNAQAITAPITTVVPATPPFPTPPPYALKNPAVMTNEKLTVKLTHQEITRLNFGAISNSSERLAGRGFFSFFFFSFLAFTGAALATLAALAAFTGSFLTTSFSLDSTLSSSPIFSPHSCVHF